MQPGFDRRHRTFETLGERLAARAAIVGEQDDLPLLLVEQVEAAHERGEPLAAIARPQGIDLVGGRLEALRHVLERLWLDAANLVERAVARDRRHPGDRRSLRWVEIPR